MDAIQCRLEHCNGEAVDVLTPYSKNPSGAIRYEAPYATERERDVVGMTGSTLTLEDQAPLRAPTLRQLSAAVDSLTPHGGPGYVILEGPGQDYTQAAGGNGTYTAEWRQYSGKEFSHWIAGIPGRPSNKEIAIPTNGCVVTVQDNECLGATDVKAILAALAERKGRPTKYTWRDGTERFT